jgi:hypothetical protein
VELVVGYNDSVEVGEFHLVDLELELEREQAELLEEALVSLLVSLRTQP